MFFCCCFFLVLFVFSIILFPLSAYSYFSSFVYVFGKQPNLDLMGKNGIKLTGK